MFNALEMEFHAELLDYIRRCELSTEKRPLKDHLAEEILRQIMRGEREIADIATNAKIGDVFVRFSFTEEGNDNVKLEL